MPKAIVCDSVDSTFRGDITISSGCVIHPSVTILAVSGPIIIGENCLVEEYTTIIHNVGATPSLEAAAASPPPTLTIGANNVFEVGCTVEALHIGERNVFESRSYVSNKVTVSNGCIIGAGCELLDEQRLPENMVVYGIDAEQREAIDKQKAQTSQLEHLRRVLPNYHHLVKATFDPKKQRGQVV